MAQFEPLFFDFRYNYNGNTYFFDDYESLKRFRLSKTSRFLRPLRMLKDDFHRAGERYYEEMFGLPDRYLSGLFHHLPAGANIKRFVRRAAENLTRVETREYIRTILALSLNKATTELTKQNINNRRLIEHHVTNQIIRSEVKRSLENQTQVLQYQSLPADLVLDTSGDPIPACNRVTLGSNDIVVHQQACHASTIELN
jgi:hypothetical protein